ncbi:MAG TPA: type II secretion system F family protein [Actinomycetes bacterium]|nr:type II secretion system F family protein [Actinomycetes bacterium]
MRRATSFLGVLAGAVLLAAAPAGARPAGGLDITSVDVARYPSVTAVVTAPPGLGGAGYPSSAFAVSEDGRPVDHTVRRVATSGLEIQLVVDTSGSMVGAPIAAARRAAGEFLAVLPADARVGVVAFGSRPSLVAGPTTDRHLLRSRIAGLHAGGETALYDAVAFAGTRFTAGAKDRVIVLLSDGGDTASTTTLDQAAATGVRTNVIELVTDESDRAVLGRLAAAGGGSVSSVADPAALAGLYRRAAASLANQYRVTYEASGHGATPLTVRIATPAGALEATTDVRLPAAATPPATKPPGPGPAAEGDGAGLGPEQVALAVGAAGIFLALLLLALLGLSVDRRSRKARAQLGVERNLVRGPGLGHLADRMTAAAEGYLDRRNQRRTLAAALEVAGISLRPGEFLVLTGVAALVAGLAGLAVGGPLGGIALVALVPLSARLVVGHLAERRRERFADLLPDTLQLLTSTLRSGYALLQALDSVAQESAEPARTEFGRVLLETRVGRDLSSALRALADRMRNRDFAWVVGAIEINREVGGDLAAVLGTTADTIRERQRVHRQMRALTAEGRLSGYILTALPVVVALAMRFINPAGFALLTSGVGLLMSAAGGVLLVAGWFWMKALNRIEL